MDRRGFLGAILAASAAPVFIKSSILMPVKKIALPRTATSASTLLYSGLQVGDIFTIAGIPNRYRVTAVTQGGVNLMERMG